MSNKEEEKWLGFLVTIFLGSIILTIIFLFNNINIQKENKELRRQLEDYKVLIDFYKKSDK